MSKWGKIAIGIAIVAVLGIGYSVFQKNNVNAYDPNYVTNAKFDNGEMDAKSFNSMLSDVDKFVASMKSKAEKLSGMTESEKAKVLIDIQEETAAFEKKVEKIDSSKLSDAQQSELAKKSIDLMDAVKAATE